MPFMHPIHINFLPVHSNEKISSYIKNGRKKSLVVRNQTQSAKNSSNAFSPETASCSWVRSTQKNSSKKT